MMVQIRHVEDSPAMSPLSKACKHVRLAIEWNSLGKSVTWLNTRQLSSVQRDTMETARESLKKISKEKT